MLKALVFRLTGFLIAALAFVPAAVGLLKGAPIDLVSVFVGFYRPLWWWQWVWMWMPSVRFPFSELSDILWSLPCLIAIAAVGVGSAMAFGARKKQSKRQRWEDEP